MRLCSSLSFSLLLPLFGALLFSSCTVDQNAAQDASRAGGSATKKTSIDTGSSFAEKMKKAQEERDAKAKARAAELAAKKEADAAEAKKLAAQKEKEEARKKALALKEAREEDARKAEEVKKKAEQLAAKKKEQADKEKARILARQKAEQERAARNRDREVPAVAERQGGSGGFFSRLAVSTPSKYKSKGHDVKVNHRLLDSLTPSNAKIEIDLSEQKARVYKTDGGAPLLVIETCVSTGKSGHSTPTGTYRIQEKLPTKNSSLYGRWVDSSGQTVQSSGDSRSRPPGASTFVGAEMPYWMRVTGGIGMHIGYVPDYPASHGCIRVPSAVQPLIYSKVGVGTTVSIIN